MIKKEVKYKKPMSYSKCKFCQTFQSIQRKKWVDNKRLCPIANKLVSSKDGCDAITLVTYIHCQKLNQRVAVEVCISNTKLRKYSRCVRCKQSKPLILLFWELNRKPKPIVKSIIKKTHHPIIKEK